MTSGGFDDSKRDSHGSSSFSPLLHTMRVLITGASGLLGRAVYNEFKENGHEAIIHCAAERRPDVAERDQEGTRNVRTPAIPRWALPSCFHNCFSPSLAHPLQLNISVPSHIGKLAHSRAIPLFYISTDYVFDGTNPPYDVNDTPNPLNFYGRTKYEGEMAISQTNPHAVTLRVPILYGHTEYNSESAVNLLVDVVLDSSKQVEMDHYVIRYPTNVEDVARVLRNLADKKIQQGDAVSGVYHFSAEEALTKGLRQTPPCPDRPPAAGGYGARGCGCITAARRAPLKPLPPGGRD
ncbi:hypothetical protein BC938DRAFT_472442 [Jimgerdemannia flammicorona]|uniref:RmlD-like substrate binding domain-containing protein n=1 Tax=Jimgerdemannia flammicorona TaxID=994334 RepID=A0A433Q649_9FUNG|nr:hypothetical protein BC938DRAFT_472442 [Jimgerdemannia flammicorona]